MKHVIKFMAGLLIGFGLLQLVDLAMYLMNRSDSYLFNLGLVLMCALLLGFGELGVYFAKLVISTIQEVSQKDKEDNV